MPVSISDVAQRANVSISTVSRVVNGRKVVNVTTRKRVEKAIAELGYRPNMFARGLMLRKSNLLGLLLPDIHGEFYSEIIRGADQCARKSKRHLLVSSIEMDDDGEAILSAVGNNGLLDGVVIMVADLKARAREALGRLSIPMVLLDGECSGVQHDTVMFDQRRGTTKLIEHVCASGDVTRLIFVGGKTSNIDTNKRLEACRDALRSLGMTLAEADTYHLDFQYSTAYEFGQKHAKDWVDPHTCVFAANDETAAGIIHAAATQGISVPDDLRVVGFDDTRLAKMLRPQLTTVNVPMSEMGATAIDLLIDRLDDAERPARAVTLQSELVIRESCGRTSK